VRAALESLSRERQQRTLYLEPHHFLFLFAFLFRFVSFCFLFPHRSLGTQNLELNDIARIITENAIVIHDPDHSDDEDRFVLLGMSAKLRVLVVCHCYRMNDDCVRLISARKAAKREQHQYFERGKQ